MERAYAVQKPSYAYDVVFLMLSQILHSSPAALAGQLQQEGAQSFAMQIGRSHEWIDTAFATVFIFFAQIVDSGVRAFSLRSEKLESVTSAFQKLHRESV